MVERTACQKWSHGELPLQLLLIPRVENMMKAVKFGLIFSPGARSEYI